MKSYPKIEYYKKLSFGKNCIFFNKLDGSNLRFEYNNKRGFYKFGTRTQLIDINNCQYGEAINIFLNKYSEDLSKIFTDKYKGVINFVVFAEFFGENSFAGYHVDSDKKDVVIFDINQYKKGFINPFEFVKNFGNLDIPEIIYEGEFNMNLVDDVKNNKFNLKEGVVVKGSDRNINWMCKIKTYEWLEKVKEKLGEKYLIEDLNGDLTIFKN